MYDWGPLRLEENAKKPIALCYGYGAWRCGVSRQAIESQNSGCDHCMRMAPGGSVVLARRYGCDRGTRRRLAPGGVRCPPGGLEPSFT